MVIKIKIVRFRFFKPPNNVIYSIDPFVFSKYLTKLSRNAKINIFISNNHLRFIKRNDSNPTNLLKDKVFMLWIIEAFIYILVSALFKKDTIITYLRLKIGVLLGEF